MAWSSCASLQEEKGEQPPSTFDGSLYEIKELSLNVGDCEDELGFCFEINWSLPYFYETWTFAALLNEALILAIDFSWGSQEISAPSLEEMLQQKEKDFLDFIEENPREGGWRWFDEAKAKVIREDSSYLCISLFSSSYYGGAHPNSFVRHFIFSKEKGMFLSADELFEDVSLVAAIVYAELVNGYELEPEIDLQEQGFFVSSSDFPLPENIGLSDSTFLFEYNPYEIGPYSMGFTSIEIPIVQLEAFLKKQ